MPKRRKRWLPPVKEPKPKKFDYEEMRAAATSEKPEVRKAAFLEYYERFGEFPSYLFDNKDTVDPLLHATIQELLNDPESSKTLLKALDMLIMRLP